MGGRGRGNPKGKGGGKGRDTGQQFSPWRTNTPSPPKGKQDKVKDKTSPLGYRKPKFTGTCSHCGITGHMARDCYKRQQGAPSVTLKQNNTTTLKESPSPHKKPALIEFQQFPTFVKRKLEGTNYHEPDDASSSVQDDDTNLNSTASAAILAVEAEGEYDSWGTKTDTTSQDTQHTWGNTSTQKQTRHNSPCRITLLDTTLL
jgi:hypothetical protein